MQMVEYLDEPAKPSDRTIIDRDRQVWERSLDGMYSTHNSDESDVSFNSLEKFCGPLHKVTPVQD